MFFRSRPRLAHPAVADEAAAHAERSWALRLRNAPFVTRMSIIFTMAFGLGLAVETFACKTGLYDAVVHKKMTRRLKMDEQILELRENIKVWQQEDMRIAEEAAKKKQEAAASSSSSSS